MSPLRHVLEAEAQQRFGLIMAQGPALSIIDERGNIESEQIE